MESIFKIKNIFGSGALGRNRTYGLQDRNLTLYPLSYKRMREPRGNACIFMGRTNALVSRSDTARLLLISTKPYTNLPKKYRSTTTSSSD